MISPIKEVEILRLWNETSMTWRAIAERLHVGRQTISKVVGTSRPAHRKRTQKLPDSPKPQESPIHPCQEVKVYRCPGCGNRVTLSPCFICTQRQ